MNRRMISISPPAPKPPPLQSLWRRTSSHVCRLPQPLQRHLRPSEVPLKQLKDVITVKNSQTIRRIVCSPRSRARKSATPFHRAFVSRPWLTTLAPLHASRAREVLVSTNLTLPPRCLSKISSYPLLRFACIYLQPAQLRSPHHRRYTRYLVHPQLASGTFTPRRFPPHAAPSSATPLRTHPLLQGLAPKGGIDMP